MVKGFKDKDGTFHPIGNYVKHPSMRLKEERMLRGAGTAQIFAKAVSDFAQKRKENFEKQRQLEKEEFQKEIQLRRSFAPKIMRAYRLAKQQQITNPQQLKKFIYSKVPELRDDKETLMFVQSIVNEYIEQETRFKKSVAGKDPQEIKKLREEFDKAIEETQHDFESELVQQEKMAKEKIQKEFDEQKKLLDEAKIKEKKLQDALEDKKKKEKELKDAEKSKSPEEIKKKVEEVQQAEKKVETAQVDQQKIEKEILSELKDIQKETKQESEVGFPEGII